MHLCSSRARLRLVSGDRLPTWTYVPFTGVAVHRAQCLERMRLRSSCIPLAPEALQTPPPPPPSLVPVLSLSIAMRILKKLNIHDFIRMRPSSSCVQSRLAPGDFLTRFPNYCPSAFLQCCLKENLPHSEPIAKVLNCFGRMRL